MPIQCRTPIHRVIELIRHAAPIRQLVKRFAHVLHPARAVVLHPRTRVETACRLLPAITMGSSLLIPRSVGLAPVHPVLLPAINTPPLTIFAPPDIGFSLPPKPVALPDPGFVWPTDRQASCPGSPWAARRNTPRPRSRRLRPCRSSSPAWVDWRLCGR